jgi:uncharacterized protein YdiU (UPF0061 family)
MNATSYTKFLKAFHKFQEEYNKEVSAKLVEVLGLQENEEACQKINEVLAASIAKPEASGSKAGAPKKKRAPTEYNLFMKERIMKLRQEHPDIDKKELMSMGAKEWQKQKADKLEAATKPAAPEKKSKSKK